MRCSLLPEARGPDFTRRSSDFALGTESSVFHCSHLLRFFWFLVLISWSFTVCLFAQRIFCRVRTLCASTSQSEQVLYWGKALSSLFLGYTMKNSRGLGKDHRGQAVLTQKTLQKTAWCRSRYYKTSPPAIEIFFCLGCPLSWTLYNSTIGILTRSV